MSKTKRERFNGLPAEVIGGPRRVLKTITIEVICEDEEVRIKGNCSAIDKETDANQEKWIQHQLDGGNPWAWCGIVVRATMDDVSGRDTLGCCSYLSGADFCRPGGYFDDMVERAVEEMMKKLSERK